MALHTATGEKTPIQRAVSTECILDSVVLSSLKKMNVSQVIGS